MGSHVLDAMSGVALCHTPSPSPIPLLRDHRWGCEGLIEASVWLIDLRPGWEISSGFSVAPGYFKCPSSWGGF